MSQSPADRPEVPRRPGDAAEPVRPSAPPRPGPLALCNLVLQRDARADLMAVVRGVMELTRFPRAEATYKMWEAHHNGRSVLFRTHRERAELYAELFADRGLTVSVEPA